MSETSPIYLDYASATPVSKRVQRIMMPYSASSFFNPSALYLAGQAVKKELEAARQRVARVLGCRPSEVYFIAGGTEANNTAIHGVMSQYPNGEIVISAVEHPSVLEPARRFASVGLPVDGLGRLQVSSLEKHITDKTVLVSVMLVNNEIGTIQPIKEVAQYLAAVRKERLKTGNRLPLYLHTDACQAANYLAVDVHRLGVDMMTLNGGKIYGPKQSGVLYVRAGVTLRPLILGGGQEQGLRSGTENVTQAIGFAEALTEAHSMCTAEATRLKNLRDLFMSSLEQLPGVRVNGSRKDRVANNVHITIQATDNERLLMELDERGVQCAVGSACHASSDEPSHVLGAIGLPLSEIQSSLRFTLGRDTTLAHLQKTTEILRQTIS